MRLEILARLPNERELSPLAGSRGMREDYARKNRSYDSALALLTARANARANARRPQDSARTIAIHRLRIPCNVLVGVIKTPVI